MIQRKLPGYIIALDWSFHSHSKLRWWKLPAARTLKQEREKRAKWCKRVFFLGSAWKLARTHARKSPAVPLQGTVIGSCHMVLNSPFFKGSGKDTEMHQGRQCEASFTHLTCQTGCWLFQQQLVCSPVRFVSGEVGKIHMLLSRYMMERSVGEKMQSSWSYANYITFLHLHLIPLVGLVCIQVQLLVSFLSSHLMTWSDQAVFACSCHWSCINFTHWYSCLPSLVISLAFVQLSVKFPWSCRCVALIMPHSPIPVVEFPCSCHWFSLILPFYCRNTIPKVQNDKLMPCIKHRRYIS